MIVARGDWSFGHVRGGCAVAALIWLCGFLFLLGACLLTLLLPPWMIGPTIVGAVVVLLVVAVPVEYFRRHGPIVRSIEVALDDGGLRVMVGGSCEYVPLAAARLELDPPAAPRTACLDGGFRRLRFEPRPGTGPAWVELSAELERRQKAASTSDLGDLAPLARGRDALPAWSARVVAFVEGERRGAGYRSAHRWDDHRLLGLLRDRHAPADLRAAAGHVLLRLAPVYALDVRGSIDGAPPIVVAMLHAAAASDLRAPFAVIEPYLSRSDRRAAERMARASSGS